MFSGSEYDFEDDDLIESYGGGIESDSETINGVSAEQQYTSQLILA